jgi:hypothetical protein
MLSKSSDAAPRPTAGDIIRDHRTRLAVEEEARAEKRRWVQAEQSASSNPPATRIRLWEKVHGLRLPLSAAHPVLEVISIGTHLTLAEVRQEQHKRSAARIRS